MPGPDPTYRNNKEIPMEQSMSETAPDTPTSPYGTSGEAERLMQYDANKKSMLLAYVLWFFLGTFGVHRFYLGATKSAVILLALWVICGAISGATGGILGFLLLIPGLWWFLDLLLIPGIVQRKNSELIAMLSR